MGTISDLCNDALSYTGLVHSLSMNDEDYTGDSTKGDIRLERNIKAKYRRIRQNTLALHPWNFATVTQEIVPVDNILILSQDMMRPVAVYSGCTSLEYETLPNYRIKVPPGYSPITFRYVNDIADASLFPPAFYELMTYLLGKDFLLSFGTPNKTTLATLERLAEQTMLQARANNMFASSMEPQYSDSSYNYRYASV